MDCDKCGAVVPEGATTCPECGVPVADTPASSSDTPAPSNGVTATETTPAGGKKTLLYAVVAAVVVILLAVGGWFLLKGGGVGGSDPKSVATKMLTAYAAYDAQGILDVSTHGSLDATGTRSFKDAAAAAKTRANGKPGVKDFTVDKVEQSGDQTATVTISGQWLTVPAKGTYAKKTEKLGLVKQNGAWLVQLF
jgi:hypothetical protein